MYLDANDLCEGFWEGIRKESTEWSQVSLFGHPAEAGN